MNENKRLERFNKEYSSEAGITNQNIISFNTAKLIKSKGLLGGSCIQLGLGDGYIASSLHKEYSKFIVLEGSHQIIQNCKDANVQYEVVETLFENFQTTHKFDILLGNHVLEHVDDPVFTLSHVRQFLKPHGKALFTVPNADSLHRKIGVELGLIGHAQELSDRDRLLGHRRVYTIDELTGHIISAGFNISDTFGYNIKIVSFAQMNDWSNDLHQAIFKISLNLPPSICSNIAILCNA